MNDQAQSQQPPEQPRQQTENERVLERKKLVVKTLTEKYNTDLWRERLLKIVGGDESRIMKSLNSFVAYIMNDMGGKEDDGEGTKSKKKVYIADCAISTISSAFLEAFQMGIEVGGGRDHAYLVNYTSHCELEISYKGFIYALGQHFDNPYVVAENVFEGDKFTTSLQGETATYSYTPNPEDPFPSSWANLKGCFCYFSYTQRDNKKEVSRIVRIQKEGPDGLDMIRSKARGSFAWKDFPFEQTKKSTLRRAAKIPFAMIDFADDEVNPEEQDNKHYQFERSSSDRLRLLIESHQEDNNAKNKVPETVGNADHHDANATGGQKPADNTEAQIIVSNPEMPSSTAGKTGDKPVDPKEQTIDGTCQTMPDDSIGNPSSSEASSAAYQGWDGKTIYMGAGKTIAKDNFASAQAAAIYLRKVINQRTKMVTRREILDGNKDLIIALAKDERHDTIKELTDLIEIGE